MCKRKESPWLAMIRNFAVLLVAMLFVLVMAGTPAVRADDNDIIASGTFKSGGTWKITEDGTLTLAGDIKCDATDQSMWAGSWPWYKYNKEILSVKIDNVTLTGTNYPYMFYGCTGLSDISDLKKIDTSNVTNMSSMFSDCKGITDLAPFVGWNVSKVTSTRCMFSNCVNLQELTGLKNWNTSKVTNMESMFSDCSSLSTLSGLEKWDVSKVGSMRQMFYNCTNLANISALADWNTSSVTDAGYMFYYCSNITSLSDLAKWDASNMTKTDHMFYRCDKLTDLIGLEDWNTSKATSVSEMFSNCFRLTDISSLEKWDIVKLNNQSAFSGCPVSVSNSGTFTSGGTWSLKDGVLTLSGNIACDITNPSSDSWPWYSVRSQIKSVVSDNVILSGTNYRYMFYYCNNLVDISSLANWDVSNVINTKSMFAACSSLTDISALSNWNTSSIVNMSSMFESCSMLISTSELKGWNTSNVTNMSSMFRDCHNLADLDGLATWNLSNVTTTQYMFDDCNSLKSLLNLKDWDTSEVTIMESMFRSCNNLTDLSGLERWDVSKVNDFGGYYNGTNAYGMFSYCDALADISAIANWNVQPNAYTTAMFYRCSNLKEVDINKWNSICTSAYYMFMECPAFNKITLPDSFKILINEDQITLEGNLSKCSTSFATEIEKNLAKQAGITNIDLSKTTVKDVTSFPKLFLALSDLTSGTFPDGGTWKLSNDGTLTLSGKIGWQSTSADSWPWAAKRQLIKKVVFKEGTSFSDSVSYLFANCTNLESIEGIENVNLASATTAKNMFYGCFKLKSIDSLGCWNVSNITDMSKMFAWCSGESETTTTDKIIDGWDIKDSVNTTDMFLGWSNDTDKIKKFEVSLSNAKDFDYDEVTNTYSKTFKNLSSSQNSEQYLSPTYSINLALAGKDSENYEPGQIQIRIPASPFVDRNGDRKTAIINWSIPKAPTVSSETPYNYSYDAATDEYVITNTVSISAASEMSFVLPYRSPHLISKTQNGAKSDDFYAKVTFPSENTFTIKTAPGIYVYTNASITELEFSGWAGIQQRTYEKDGYLYFQHNIDLGTKIAQEATITIESSSSIEGSIGKSVRYSNVDSSGSSRFTFPYDTSEVVYSAPAVGWPITDDMKDGKTHELDYTITLTLVGADGAYDVKTITYKYQYKYNTFSVSDYNKFYKTGDSYYAQSYSGRYNGINQLLLKKSVQCKYYIYSEMQEPTLTFANGSQAPNDLGKENWNFLITDNEVSLNKDFTELLSVSDYDIEGISINIKGYEYKEGISGWTEVQTDSPNYNVYYKDSAGNWHFYRTVQSKSSSSDSTYIALPSGSTGFKIDGSSSLYKIVASTYVTCNIRPSEKVLSQISDDTNYLYIYNKANLNVSDSQHTTIYDSTSKATASFGRVQLGNDSSKKVEYTQNNTKKQGFDVRFRAYAATRVNSSYGITDEFYQDIIPSQTTGYFYDLLPIGSTLEDSTISANSIYIQQSSFSSTSTATARFTYRTIDNFNNTGRTLLIVNVTAPNAFKNKTIGYELYYTVFYPYDSIQDFGQTLRNDFIYEAGNALCGGNKTASDWVTDISSVTNNVDEKIFVSDSVSTTVSVGSAVSLELSKSAKDSDSTTYLQGHDGEVVASQGETYSYKLRFGSSAGTTSSNIILFDSLENYTTEDGKSSGWRGTLQSIDLSQPKLKGIDPVVYYSTVKNLDLSVAENHDITNTKVWTTTEPSDLSAVAAVAIDMRKATDGTDYVLPELSTIRVTINMTAPTGDDYIVPARAGLRTYNNVYLSNSISTSTGYTEPQYIHYDYTEVALLKPVEIQLSASKTLSDPIGSGKTLSDGEFSFKLLDKNGNVLQTKTNKADGSVLFDPIEIRDAGNYNYKVVEVIPDDAKPVTDEDGNITGYETDTMTYDSSEKSVTVTTKETDGELTVAE